MFLLLLDQKSAKITSQDSFQRNVRTHFPGISIVPIYDVKILHWSEKVVRPGHIFSRTNQKVWVLIILKCDWFDALQCYEIKDKTHVFRNNMLLFVWNKSIDRILFVNVGRIPWYVRVKLKICSGQTQLHVHWMIRLFANWSTGWYTGREGW